MEKELINWLSDYLGDVDYCCLGIGDDAAVLRAENREIVFSTDSICDGVHFLSNKHTPEQIGRKSLAVNLSDLAAMGAEPRAAVISLVLPDDASLEYAKRLFYGIRPLAEEHRVEVCGGDIAVWKGKLTITVSVIGVAPTSGAWRIDSAKPGDAILVTGSFGGSILGRHIEFQPRCQFSRRWAEEKIVRAATDASDSLSLDLQKMATASQVGFELEADQIPVSPDAWKLAARNGKADDGFSALEHALFDGEDFELIVAVNVRDVSKLIAESSDELPLTCIGNFIDQPGCWLKQDGQRIEFQPRGFQHQLLQQDNH